MSQQNTARTRKIICHDRALSIPRSMLGAAPQSIISCAGYVKRLPSITQPHGYVSSKKFRDDARLHLSLVEAYDGPDKVLKGSLIRFTAKYDPNVKRYRVIRIDSVVPPDQ